MRPILFPVFLQTNSGKNIKWKIITAFLYTKNCGVKFKLVRVRFTFGRVEFTLGMNRLKLNILHHTEISSHCRTLGFSLTSSTQPDILVRLEKAWRGQGRTISQENSTSVGSYFPRLCHQVYSFELFLLQRLGSGPE